MLARLLEFDGLHMFDQEQLVDIYARYENEVFKMLLESI
jgi:hypothetical protein